MKPDTRKMYKEKIFKVLLYIQEHLDEPLTLEELAGAAHLSVYHFHRIFRGMVGEGVIEHVRRLRLERAAYQLIGTTWPVTRIAFDAGYETHESFSRAFKARFGESPSAFRARRKWTDADPSAGEVRYAPGGKLMDFTPIDTGGRKMDAKIENMPPRKVVFMRHVGPYDQVGPTWEKLCAWAGPKGLLRPGVATLGVGYDDPDITDPDKIRYDACIEVDREIEAEGEVGFQEIPGGDYAVAVHQGPYTGLKEFYAKLYGQWLPAQNREVGSSPCYEEYLNDPAETPPEELLVKICIPLQS